MTPRATPHAASENFIGKVAAPLRIVDFTPVLDTGIYADNDTLFIATEVTNFVRKTGGSGVLLGFQLIDQADQKIALDIIIAQATFTTGAANAAFAGMTDAQALTILTRINVATGDYYDLVDFAVAEKAGLNRPLAASVSTRSLWVAGVTRGGTPTYAVGSLTFRFFIEDRG